MSGRLKQAAACRMIAVTTGDRAATGAERISNAVAAIQLAEILYESNQCEAAQRLLFANAPLIQEVSLPDALITAHVIQSRIADGQGRLRSRPGVAERTGRQRLPPGRWRVRWPVHAWSAPGFTLRMAMRLRRWARADAGRARAVLGEELASRWLIANDTLTPDIARLRWMIRTGEAEQALPLLRDGLADAEVQHRARRALKLRILLAEALHVSGEHASWACVPWRGRSNVAQPEGFLRTFLEEGPVVQAMLREIGLRRHEGPGGNGAAQH